MRSDVVRLGTNPVGLFPGLCCLRDAKRGVELIEAELLETRNRHQRCQLSIQARETNLCLTLSCLRGGIVTAGQGHGPVLAGIRTHLERVRRLLD